MKRGATNGLPPALIESLAPADARSALLHRRLYERLRQAIASDQLTSGARLPSSRRLAAELNVSRGTIVAAYELLEADGLVATQVGSGTIVAPLSVGRRQTDDGAAPRPATAPRVTDPGPFGVGVPAYDRFPAKAWANCVARTARATPRDDLGYQSATGLLDLRRQLALYLQTRRGLRCDVAQIMVVPGFQAALDLTVRTLLSPGDEVWVEDPGHGPTRAALAERGLRIRGVAVDGDGLDVEAAHRAWPAAKLAIVTPVHQFPLGVTLTPARRTSLLDWAATTQGWIVEDDYDTEFHFNGVPPDALAAASAAADRVIYAGTFSKVLFPSLRVGYLVVPHALVARFEAVRRASDGHQPVFMQRVLSRFIADGHFERHLARMRALYRTRKAALEAGLAHAFAERLAPLPSDGGTHLAALFGAGVDDCAFARRAEAAGLALAPLSAFRLEPGAPGLVIGFSNCPPPALAAGLATLGTLGVDLPSIAKRAEMSD